MGAVTTWVWANKDWLFAGIGVAILAGAIQYFRKQHTSAEGLTIQNTNVVNLGSSSANQTGQAEASDDLKSAKDRTRILFIDDDVSFPVVKILKQAGWTHTRIQKDVKSLDDVEVQSADIFFVDIQGVGKLLRFADEGLGLARALKQKYPKKKLVIYSAEPKGDMFHQAFRIADDQLSKTADPYEFQTVVERLVQSSR